MRKGQRDLLKGKRDLRILACLRYAQGSKRPIERQKRPTNTGIPGHGRARREGRVTGAAAGDARRRRRCALEGEEEEEEEAEFVRQPSSYVL